MRRGALHSHVGGVMKREQVKRKVIPPCMPCNSLRVGRVVGRDVWSTPGPHSIAKCGPRARNRDKRKLSLTCGNRVETSTENCYPS